MTGGHRVRSRPTCGALLRQHDLVMRSGDGVGDGLPGTEGAARQLSGTTISTSTTAVEQYPPNATPSSSPHRAAAASGKP